MIYVGVTGQNGFIGKNLLNYLNKYPNKFKIIFFENIFFQNDIDLDTWVKKCNVIFHLAAISRHIDPKIVFKTNLELVKKIINSIQRTESKPHLIFTSSIHEERDTEYGKSKKQSRELFSEWSVQNKTIFTGFLLPNVFGPLAKPNYASVVATFSNNLIENKKNKTYKNEFFQNTTLPKVCNFIINKTYHSKRQLLVYYIMRTSIRRICL